MSVPAGAVWLLLLAILALLAVSFLGGVPGLTVVLALAGIAGLLRRTGALAGADRLARPAAALSAALVAGTGLLFMAVLVANPSDNAYLWIWLLGWLLVAIAVPFALAAMLPAGAARRWIARAAVALVWGVGLAGALLLLLGAPLYLLSSAALLPGGRVDERVAPNHVLGSLLLVALVWLAGSYLPRRPAPP